MYARHVSGRPTTAAGQGGLSSPLAFGKHGAMAKGQTIEPLKLWRSRHGLTMEEAGARIVVDGKPVDRGTWHAWETGKKIPKPAWMHELERVTGVEPNAFYPRPDADEINPSPPAQLAFG